MKVIMTRERITHAFEHIVNPENPDEIVEELYENDDMGGWWNEYYKVYVVPEDWTENDLDSIEEMFDFYSYKEAKEEYDRLSSEIKRKNAEKEIREYEDAGLDVPEKLLRERYM